MIFLDMDGVCCDFVSKTIEIAGKNKEEVYKNWPKGHYEVADMLGMTTEQLRKTINEVGPWFWNSLEPYPWFEEMYTSLCRIDKVIFLTSPGHFSTAAQGKVEWLNKHIHPGFDNYIITKHKHLVSKPGLFLIDDHVGNCNDFKSCGGGVYIFPQLWNNVETRAEDASVEAVEAALRYFRSFDVGNKTG